MTFLASALATEFPFFVSSTISRVGVTRERIWRHLRQVDNGGVVVLEDGILNPASLPCFLSFRSLLGGLLLFFQFRRVLLDLLWCGSFSEVQKALSV